MIQDKITTKTSIIQFNNRFLCSSSLSLQPPAASYFGKHWDPNEKLGFAENCFMGGIAHVATLRTKRMERSSRQVFLQMSVALHISMCCFRSRGHADGTPLISSKDVSSKIIEAFPTSRLGVVGHADLCCQVWLILPDFIVFGLFPDCIFWGL